MMANLTGRLTPMTASGSIRAARRVPIGQLPPFTALNEPSLKLQFVLCKSLRVALLNRRHAGSNDRNIAWGCIDPFVGGSWTCEPIIKEMVQRYVAKGGRHANRRNRCDGFQCQCCSSG
jgi:hypothetical protein